MLSHAFEHETLPFFQPTNQPPKKTVFKYNFSFRMWLSGIIQFVHVMFCVCFAKLLYWFVAHTYICIIVFELHLPNCFVHLRCLLNWSSRKFDIFFGVELKLKKKKWGKNMDKFNKRNKTDTRKRRSSKLHQVNVMWLRQSLWQPLLNVVFWPKRLTH